MGELVISRNRLSSRIAYKLISPVFILILIPKVQIPRVLKKYTRYQKKFYLTKPAQSVNKVSREGRLKKKKTIRLHDSSQG